MYSLLYMWMCACACAFSLSLAFSSVTILSIEYTNTNHFFMIFIVVIVVVAFFRWKFSKKKSIQIKSNQTLLHSFKELWKHIHTTPPFVHNKCTSETRLNRITDDFPSENSTTMEEAIDSSRNYTQYSGQWFDISQRNNFFLANPFRVFMLQTNEFLDLDLGLVFFSFQSKFLHSWVPETSDQRLKNRYRIIIEAHSFAL